MFSMVVRFLVSAVVLLVASWFIPFFVINGIMGAVVAALVIALLGYAAEALFGDRITSMHRGIVGFLVSAAVIWLSQLLVPNAIQTSVIGALIAALIIGAIDAVLPTPLTPKALPGGGKR
ncbi:phage holin family protein [Heliobacterium undosum]|uniref:Phage holin family protein n=1 Tax=Heliomicrobium undosum TaxID=121734 RepID=A0A845KZX4_9FIRM|nr:phage holin family protein [Heliomicrobium undosum]MZP28816.1 phage holin family protein [Heliomicrobium undosum]